MTPRPEPYFHSVSSLASRDVYVIGPNGDDDPGYALESVVVSNTGATGLRIAASLDGVVGTRHILLPTALAPVELEGPFNSLVFKTNTDAASTFSVTGMGYYRNSARDGGVKPSQGPGVLTRYRPGELGFVANTSTDTVVQIKGRETLSALKLWATAAPSGATIELTMTDSKGRSLLAAAFDLESLVAATLTSVPLTTSTDLLTVERGPVTLTVRSTNGADTCDVAFELSTTEA